MIPGPYRNLALIGFMGSGKSSAGIRAGRAPALAGGRRRRRDRARGGKADPRHLHRRRRVGLPRARGAGGDAAAARDRGRGRAGRRRDHLAADPRAPARRVVHGAAGRLPADGVAADRGRGRRPPPGAPRRAASPSSTRTAAALYHATADALVDAEEVHGDEALLAPLARPSALAELGRLIGARRAALVADRSVLRMVGPPCEPFVTVRLPVGEAAKTVAVARQAWTRLAEFGLERGDVIVGMGGGAATDLAGFVAATYHRGVPWIAVPTSLVGMVDAAIGGKTGIDLPSGQERDRLVPPARVGGVRPGRARDPAGARMGMRLRRGDQDRAPRRRPAVGDGARLGAGPGHARAAAGADPPLRGLQGADRRRRPDRARPPGGAEPGPLHRPRDRGGDRLQGVRPRRGGRHRAPVGAMALGPDRKGSTRPSRRRCASCCAGTSCR